MMERSRRAWRKPGPDQWRRWALSALLVLLFAALLLPSPARKTEEAAAEPVQTTEEMPAEPPAQSEGLPLTPVSTELTMPAEAGAETETTPVPESGEEISLAAAFLSPDLQRGRGYGFAYNSVYADYRLHAGQDFLGELGMTVLVPWDCTVSAISRSSADDRLLVLDFGGGYRGTFWGVEPRADLAEGMALSAGETLGTLTEPPAFEQDMPPHVHLELYLDGKSIGPEL